MRIYRRGAFLELPPGVLFRKGEPWVFGTLCIKGDTLTNDAGKNIDFSYKELAWVNSTDSGDLFDRLGQMLHADLSYEMEDAEARDGCFNEDDLFLVLEKGDVAELMLEIQGAFNALERE